MAGKQRLVMMFVDVALVTDQNSEIADFWEGDNLEENMKHLSETITHSPYV